MQLINLKRLICLFGAMFVLADCTAWAQSYKNGAEDASGIKFTPNGSIILFGEDYYFRKRNRRENEKVPSFRIEVIVGILQNNSEIVRNLTIIGCPDADKVSRTLSVFKGQTNLTSISLVRCNIDALDELVHLKSLKQLEIKDCNSRIDKSMERIIHSVGITSITLECNVDYILPILARSKSLEAIHIINTEISDSMFIDIPENQSVNLLSFKDVGHGGLRHLTTMHLSAIKMFTSLVELQISMSGSTINDFSFINSLHSLRKLRRLYLAHTGISVKDLIFVSNLEFLEEIVLLEEGLSAHDLDLLKQMPNIRKIELNGSVLLNHQ